MGKIERAIGEIFVAMGYFTVFIHFILTPVLMGSYAANTCFSVFLLCYTLPVHVLDT